jgi:hypothetical protein
MSKQNLALAATLISILSTTAAQAADCKPITDALERLRCFDTQQGAGPTPDAKQPPVAAPAAIDPLLSKARTAVAHSLKDPPSARFDGVVKKAEAVCGFVNAKNSYGGYVGRTRFAYVTKGGEVFLEVPITMLSTANLGEYERADKALTTYCPGVKSPYIKD